MLWLIATSQSQRDDSQSWSEASVAGKKKTKTTKSQKQAELLAEMDEHIRIARELADRGWLELKAKYAAEGKEMPVRGPQRLENQT